jgi:transcriptional repressor NrdR
MRCPLCSGGPSQVLDSREVGRYVRRRRLCRQCGRHFTTYEGQASPGVDVIKRDGRVEGYDRAKVLASIRGAALKRPVAPRLLESAVDGVEAELAHVGQPAVDTGQIAELVLAQLAALDEVTYLRYASSARRFREAEEFVAEIERLRELQRRHAEARVQLRLQFDEDQPHWN